MMRGFIGLTAVSILILSVSLCSGLTRDEYHGDRVVVRIAESAGDINIIDMGNIDYFGIDEIDNVIDGKGIDRIEKYFQWAEKPDDPDMTDLSRIFFLYFPVEADFFGIIDDLSKCKDVEYAEPSYIHKMFYLPNDPNFNGQWGLSESITQAASAFDLCRGDSRVIIAIVDSGMDMDHPDLVDNVWQNMGEDANGDSILDLWDWNYFDDDNNGHIDDFWGWDFIDNDNDPSDDISYSLNGGHGTHCAGIASAQTDNGTGIASLGFDCSLMTCKTGEALVVYSGMAGVGYAMQNGADVISLSWGGTNYSGAEQQTFNSAYENGILVVAAAGNENTSSYHYPSAYNNVMAVAATTSSDTKAGFSNFGNWITISAPGSQIFSTMLNGTYVTWDETSMACPFAAGLAGLIKSADMNLVAEDIWDIITSSADNINAQNPGYIGLLGAGRINAYRALASILPALSLEEYTITDNGNGDNRPDPGETCEIVVTIHDDIESQTAYSLEATLTCDDNSVEIIDGEYSFGNINPGNTLDNSSNPFTFSVNQCDPHFVTFNLNLTCTNTSIDIPLEIEIGRPGILLVDDDDGGAFNSYYEISFDSLDTFIDVWEQENSYISSEELDKYEVVLWETGNSRETLDDYEQAVLTNYLVNHGNLIFSSTNAGADLQGTSFYSDYLHANFLDDTVTAGFMLSGVEGHPFADNTSLFLIGGSGAGNNGSLDAVEAINGGLAAYTYDNTLQTACVSFEGDYKLVYFSMPLEAVSGMNFTTPRHIVISNIIDWFGYNAVENFTSELTPSRIFLSQNYPNPFNPETEITFSLPSMMNVSLTVFDATGRVVDTIHSGMLAAGVHTFTFNGEMLASGIYFARLETPSGSNLRKMVLLK